MTIDRAVDMLENCIARLREGTLSEENLEAVSEALRSREATQSLLYLQTATSSVTSKVIGMTMLVDGVVDDLVNEVAEGFVDEFVNKFVNDLVNDCHKIRAARGSRLVGVPPY